MVANWLFSALLCALPTAFCVLVWRKSPLVKSFGRTRPHGHGTPVPLSPVGRVVVMRTGI